MPDPDNMFFLADLLELHPWTSPKTDWPDLLENRVVLKTGTLGVHRISNCYTFLSAGTPVREPQPLADGRPGDLAGMRYTVPFQDFVDLIFFTKGSTSPAVGALRFRPAMSLLLDVSTTPGHASPCLGEVDEFQLFYKLIDVPLDQRVHLFCHSGTGRQAANAQERSSMERRAVAIQAVRRERPSASVGGPAARRGD